ncbi:hypothetical protein ACFYX8_35425 [Streptomyces cyaneofuscatus]|uniref:hypothetical protein n=1 Tax=Streptomyces cyaneofuscatus TaxID=66883 RepID=UPI0036C36E9D
MTAQPERLHHLLDRARRGVILPAEGEALAELVGELEQQLNTARTTTQRLNYRAQQAESKNATFQRAVRQWDVNERGTYIPHTSLRAIGIAAGTDILGSVRHLKHFQRVEQAEARIRDLEADLHRYEEVVVGDLNEANIGLQRQAATAEARVRELEAATAPAGIIAYHLPNRPNAWVCAGHIGEWLHQASRTIADADGNGNSGACAWGGCQHNYLTNPYTPGTSP